MSWTILDRLSMEFRAEFERDFRRMGVVVDLDDTSVVERYMTRREARWQH